ncbi:carboxypeptidase regulatory-like domain-containing protein [Candidatus Woesearchaeota archaeon]|nr:carboxypeptidase regulatory-like domain-containing protein [Candidatus Woesearchaeota archaeon]
MVKTSKTTSFLLMILFAIMLVGIVFAQSNNIEGTIRGKVSPIDSNATVYIKLSKEIISVATINDEGEYSFTLPIGIYDILVVSTGNYVNKTLFQIGVKENQVTEVQDIILAKIGETGSISGYVNPIIEGIKVEIKKFGSGEFGGSSVVDSNGRYEINGLEPDTYGIFIKFNSTQNFYDYKWSMIDILANTSLTGIDLTFTPKTSKYLLDRIIVEFIDGLSEGEKRKIIGSFNSKLMEHYSYSRNYLVSVQPNKTVEEMAELLKGHPKIKDASLDRIISIGKIQPVETPTIIPNESSNNIKYSNSNISKKSENKSKITTIPVADTDMLPQSYKLKSRVKIVSFIGILLLLIMLVIILKFRKR